MDDDLQALERRLAQAEQEIARLKEAISIQESKAISFTAPVHIVDERGKTALILSADGDGGYLHLNDDAGRRRVTLGCNDAGGWLDIIKSEGEELAITLTVTDEGGSIELTRGDGVYILKGERYLSRGEM